MELASVKTGFDTFNFDISSNKFMYIRSNTLYGNNPTDIQSLIDLSLSITPVGSGNYFYGEFTVPSMGQYLYLIWDYRKSLPLELCYSTVDVNNSCCGCNVPEPPQSLCYSDLSALDACCNCATE